MSKEITKPQDFSTCLNQELIEFCRMDLGETEERRNECLNKLRKWILKNDRIRTARFDDIFLLRFIRTKKFRQIEIENCFERYLLLRQIYDGKIFLNMNMHDENLIKLLNLGYAFALPQRDQFNRRIMMYRPGVFDLKKYNKYELLKMHGIAYETLMENEEDQIRGVVHLVDANGIDLSYLTLFTPKEAIRIGLNAEIFLPMRHKAIHAFNINRKMKFAIDFGLSLTSNKYKKRIFFYNRIDDLKDFIPFDLLPIEYGGIIPMKDMIDKWKIELAQNQSRIHLNDQMFVNNEMYSYRARIGAVSALKEKFDNYVNNNDNDDHLLIGNYGSFRKLDID